MSVRNTTWRDSPKGLAWYYEPRLGEQVFTDMLREAKVEVLFNHRLRESNGVVKSGDKVVSIATEDGTTYQAKIFADCSYEGDLMAQAKVTYTWGRESSSQYGESLAGVRDRTPFHQFLVPISAKDSNGRVLPEVSTEPKGPTGSADKKVQAYNFRMILTDVPANRIAFPKPPDYDPHRYELLSRLLAANTKKLGRAPDAARSLADCPNPERQSRLQQQRTIFDRLHRQKLGLPERLLRQTQSRFGTTTSTTPKAFSTSWHMTRA